ncbi:MAG: hypothetical protein ABII90_16230 [Bacteroidota bacterium]
MSKFRYIELHAIKNQLTIDSSTYAKASVDKRQLTMTMTMNNDKSV